MTDWKDERLCGKHIVIMVSTFLPSLMSSPKGDRSFYLLHEWIPAMAERQGFI